MKAWTAGWSRTTRCRRLCQAGASGPGHDEVVLRRERPDRLRGRAPRTDDEQLPSDAEALVHDLLGSQVDVGGGHRRTVAEILTDDAAYKLYHKALEHGLAAVRTDGRTGPRDVDFASLGGVFVHPATLKRFLLKGTRWGEEGVDLDQLLLRVSDHTVRKPKRLAGKVVNGIVIPKVAMSLERAGRRTSCRSCRKPSRPAARLRPSRPRLSRTARSEAQQERNGSATAIKSVSLRRTRR